MYSFCIIFFLVGIGSYFVYVKNSSNENLDRESLCARIQNNERQSLKWNITCKNDQAITGDQIVILRETTRGSLIVYDIKVFRKYSRFPHLYQTLRLTNYHDNFPASMRA